MLASVSLMMEGAAQKGIALRDAEKQQQVTGDGGALVLLNSGSMHAHVCIQPRHCHYVIPVLLFPLRYQSLIIMSAAVVTSLIIFQLAASVNAILESSYRTAAAQASSSPSLDQHILLHYSNHHIIPRAVRRHRRLAPAAQQVKCCLLHPCSSTL